MLKGRARKAAGAAREYPAHVQDELMPKYSLIIGRVVLPGMEAQGPLLSVSDIHAGTGTG